MDAAFADGWKLVDTRLWNEVGTWSWDIETPTMPRLTDYSAAIRSVCGFEVHIEQKQPEAYVVYSRVTGDGIGFSRQEWNSYGPVGIAKICREQWVEKVKKKTDIDDICQTINATFDKAGAKAFVSYRHDPSRAVILVTLHLDDKEVATTEVTQMQMATQSAIWIESFIAETLDRQIRKKGPLERDFEKQQERIEEELRQLGQKDLEKKMGGGGYNPKTYKDYKEPKKYTGAVAKEAQARMEASRILTFQPAFSKEEHHVYVSGPSQTFGLDANAETLGMATYHNLRKFVIECTKGQHHGLWAPDTLITNKTPYGEWLLDLKAAIDKKDRDEINLSLTNMHIEFWREKGLLAA